MTTNASAHVFEPFSTRDANSKALPSSIRRKLMIVGPVEVATPVLHALAEHPLPQHAPEFLEAFGSALENLRHLLYSTRCQPFILSGSGSLGWDLIAANLFDVRAAQTRSYLKAALQQANSSSSSSSSSSSLAVEQVLHSSLLPKAQRALLLHTGYFSDSFMECFANFGIEHDSLYAQPGHVVEMQRVKEALEAQEYHLLTFTHVDTSTGIRNDVEALVRLARSIQPDILIAVDSVCALGAEMLRFDDWDVDVVMSCSQKALGVPPGLTVFAMSPRALRVMDKTPPSTYYCNLKQWLPIMRNYEARKGSYYCTPNVSLVRALSLSLQIMVEYGIDRRYRDHARYSRAIKAAFDALELKQVPATPSIAANLMTTAYYPETCHGPTLIRAAHDAGVWLGGGLQKQIATKSFRFGCMGVSACCEQDPEHQNDARDGVAALEAGLKAAGYVFETGIGLRAFDDSLKNNF